MARKQPTLATKRHRYRFIDAPVLHVADDFYSARVISTVRRSPGTPSPHATEEKTMKYPTSYRTAQIDGLSIFYREAGPKNAPTILLLHGLPSSSRMFEP